MQEIDQRLHSPFYKAYALNSPYPLTAYPKHNEFVDSTLTHRVVNFRAANRVGKTFLAAYCMAVWMTGLYPSWWKGRVFKGPVSAWIVGVDGQQLRDAYQTLLLESAFTKGDGGLIPKECIIRTTSKKAPPGAILDLYVKHVSGGESDLTFKGYEQGRENFQGAKKDIIQFDEEPPMDIFSECEMRTISGEADGDPGLMLVFATPLKAFTPFVKLFTKDDGKPDNTSGKKLIVATWEDVPHLSEKEKAMMLENMQPHEIEARTKGIPYLGGGMVWPVSPTRYVVKHPKIDFPRHYKFINGLDTGSNTFAVFCAYDTVTKDFWVYGEKLFTDVPIAVKALSLSQISHAPYMADTSTNQTTEVDQKNLKDYYEECGLTIKHPNKKLKETTIAKVYHMMVSGQLKISEECRQLTQCILAYIRNTDGLIRKQDNPDDHPVDAFLYAVQGIPFAETVQETEAQFSYNNAVNSQLFFDNDLDPSHNDGWI